MKSAVVVGASSGIGRALSRLLARDGYVIGLAARRRTLLEELQRELPGRSYVETIDVTRVEEARRALQSLIDRLGGVDLIVLSSGVSIKNPSWEEKLQTIEVNVTGFVALADVAMNHFIERGSGHLVGLSSIAGLRGARAEAATYGATKAFVSNYMEALRLTADLRGLDIQVTDVRPGYVDTPMTEGQSGMFWLADVETAARQIHAAIKKRKRIAYITRRWRLIAWLLKTLPYSVAMRVLKRFRSE